MEPNNALPSAPAGDPPRVLARLPTVLKMTGLGRSTIYRWIADGSFPPPVRLGPRAVAWRWSDLERWTQSRSRTTNQLCAARRVQGGRSPAPAHP
jgi:prophage regulatory protein